MKIGQRKNLWKRGGSRELFSFAVRPPIEQVGRVAQKGTGSDTGLVLLWKRGGRTIWDDGYYQG